MQKQSTRLFVFALLALVGCAVSATEDDDFLYGDAGLNPLTQADASQLDADLIDATTPLDAFVYELPDATLDSATPNDAGRDASADASRPDGSLPDASRPDGSLPDASRPDASQPDASNGGSCKADTCPACGDGKDRCCVTSSQCGCKYLFNTVCLPD